MKLKTIIIALTFFLYLPQTVFAHPGRTASDGCHYCRTNCDKWGVPWNERHCHGKGSSPAVNTNPAVTQYETPTVVISPIQTILPTSTPTESPTSTVIPIYSPTPTNTPTPTINRTPINSQTTTVTPTFTSTPTLAIKPTTEMEIRQQSTNVKTKTQNRLGWWRLTPFTTFLGIIFGWK